MDWRRAGSRIHALQGLYRVEAGGEGPLSKEGAMLVGSYEAEQHLLHFGLADVPVCWTSCGRSRSGRSGGSARTGAGGWRTHTAEQLRIGSATLYRKLESYGLAGGKGAARKGAEAGAASGSSS